MHNLRGRKKFNGRDGSSKKIFNNLKIEIDKSKTDDDQFLVDDDALSESNEHRFIRAKKNDLIDRRYGFELFIGPGEKIGWLYNMHPTDMLDESKRLVSAVNFYFLQADGSRFKITRSYLPYFYLAFKSDQNIERDMTTYLIRRYSGRISGIEVVTKEDLDLPNHLTGLKALYLKIVFFSVDELVRVRRELSAKVKANKELASSESTYTDMLAEHFSSNNDATGISLPGSLKTNRGDLLDNLIDIREADVPYLTRVCIDLNIFAACWFSVKCRPGHLPELAKHEDTVAWPEPIVLAFDIETTKLPLKFPDSANDQIIMISYMLDGAGYLICNREILSEDIDDFDFTPKPEFPGHFTVHNLANELECINFFFEHIQKVRPNIIVTYNGDMFDWPFVEARAATYGLSMSEEIGFSRQRGTAGPGRDGLSGEYLSRPVVHIDCLCWVKRDSYLPVGARGLKAVAKTKLRYDPIEVDPEAMCRMARESPRQLANYSVSDAVATYYLYMKYVHPFVFALCTILPLNPDDVLRKGSGTLCEALLMVQAYAANVVFPHKQTSSDSAFGESDLAISGNFTDDGRMIDSETYVGGHVEALEAGVFRADIPVRFRLVPAALEALRADVKRCVRRALLTEIGAEDEDALDNYVSIESFNKVCQQVEDTLNLLSTTPNRIECPVIYHLDVGAMYPNIILTNRLQPSAVDSNSTARCANCHFYKPDVSCQRFMPWTWRAELWTASRPEVYRVQAQLSQERFPIKVADPKDGQVKSVLKAFYELSKEDQAAVKKKRLTEYCRRAYKRIHTTRIEERTAMVCQRENSFYVDTVRAFRDRRYKFKGLTKVWKRRCDEASAALASGTGDPSAFKEANSMLVLYDSLQLAHKCILNSFYGYVMRRGARWYSMEMAGIVCHTGANIITKAREIIEQIGRGLELDTDGIWCILPASFPQNLEFSTIGPKPSRVFVSYPGAILNIMVQDCFTNDQYHELVDTHNLVYNVRSENSIFFEVDGPYKAMILPAAKEEGKRLKKRYAVFNFDGSLAELKGFEIKRNGELQLIKIFQSSVFEAFMKGHTLADVYQSVASVADHWLDILYSKGVDLPDSELFHLISENRSMSKRLEDYGSQKSTSLSTARRMAEFLGDQIVKDAGLSCRFVISRQPEGAPVTDRAIPLTIFQAEPSVKRHYLRKWLKDTSLDECTDLRDILDWEYYIERLSSTIQKIITIPAALQQVPNPVSRVHHPDWLLRRLSEKTDVFKQRKLTDMFNPLDPNETVKDDKPIVDIEQLADDNVDKTLASNNSSAIVTKHVATTKRSRHPSGLPKPWREQLGDPPSLDDADSGDLLMAWIVFHQTKWRIQLERRKYLAKMMQSGGGSNPMGLNADDFLPLVKRQCGMARYLNQTRMNLFHSIWQIIEIVPDPGQLGRYHLWILIDNPGSTNLPALHSIQLTVPRRFFVNLRTPKPKDAGPLYRKVAGSSSTGADSGSMTSCILPRNHCVHHLYEYNVPEDVYAAHESEIRADLTRPDIEGVYELGVPSLFRLVAKLGCLCKVDSDALGLKSGQNATVDDVGFNLDQLRFCSMAQHPYLNTNALRYAFLFHYQLPGANQPTLKRDPTRQLYLLIVPWTQTGYVCLIDSAKVNHLPDLANVYARQKVKLFAHHSSTPLPVPDRVNFEIRVESDAASGRRWIQRCLTTLRQGKNPTDSAQTQSALPIVVLLHASSNTSGDEDNWPMNDQMISRRRTPQMTALTGFPVIPLGGTLDENENQLGEDNGDGAAADAYSLLNWQQTVVKRGVRYYLQSKLRLLRQTELARYMHIPVGNIPVADSPMPITADMLSDVERAIQQPASCSNAIELGCDLFYSRYLAKHNHILWCSTTGHPDLGGKETDDQRLLLEMEESGVVEVNHAGLYPHVTVELELANLAVDTLIVANRIPELEGATLMSFDRLAATDRPLEDQLNQGVNLGANITNYDETAACSAAFRILRMMVLAWVKDVTDLQNPLADEQIIYFYQWLRSPHSLFYDPALRRTVQKLMKKVFLKLVDDLTHLHVSVVYASFSRLVVSTYRTELPEALARVDHFTRLLRTRTGTLFTHLDFQYVASWRQLLWMDAANYAGIKASTQNLVNGKDVEWGETLDELTDNDEESKENLTEPELDMRWHMARYLPETRGLRSKFESFVAGYVLAVYQSIRTEHRRLKGMSTIQVMHHSDESNIADAHPPTPPNPTESLESKTHPYQTDASLSPGVLQFQEQLLRNQLGPELYNLVIRLQRKSAWIDTSSMLTNTIPSKSLQDTLDHHAHVISTYLAEKSLKPSHGGDDNEEALHLVFPLLPPHYASDSLHFTPLLDFVKMLCEILSLEPSTKLQVAGIRRDLLRLLGVGEFLPEASWIAPHQIRDCALTEQPAKTRVETAHIRSLLVYLPEVSCPMCNFIRDIDVCRDVHLVWLANATEAQTDDLGHWTWACPHCQTIYPRGRLEEALVQQLEQISLQHCLQDLQCSKCLVGGGIQESVLACGGSVGQCAECSGKLSLTIPTGQALYRRLDVYRVVGSQFGFSCLEQMAYWLMQTMSPIGH